MGCGAVRCGAARVELVRGGDKPAMSVVLLSCLCVLLFGGTEPKGTSERLFSSPCCSKWKPSINVLYLKVA